MELRRSRPVQRRVALVRRVELAEIAAAVMGYEVQWNGKPG
jgi:hypothetical protein